MDFARDQRNPTKHLTGFTIVVIMHIILGYALVNGLGKVIVEVVKKPFETKIVEEKKPPELEPPPPPPPTPTIKPTLPTPFVPPPDIQIQVPVQQVQTTITTQNSTPTPPPPRPTPVVAAPKASVRINAIIDSAKNCAKPVFPPASLRLEEEGTTVLAMLIGPDGLVTDSKIDKSSGYDRLDEAARSALKLCKFKPAMVDGKPEQAWGVLSYRWVIPK